MNLATIAIGLLLLALVGLALRRMVKKGNSCGSCGGCPSAGNCTAGKATHSSKASSSHH